MPRIRLTVAQRVRIFDAAGGRCRFCKLVIHANAGEKWEVAHVKALWKGGSNDESNLRPAHIKCHRGETNSETGERSKGIRTRARYLGIKRPSKGKPLPGTFQSGIKLPMNGPPIWRDSGKPIGRR
jgi:5-methylcytosine-specific restriction enzyme A